MNFFTIVAGLGDCLVFIVSLAELGIRLCDVDYMGEWGGEFGSCVWVTRAIVGRVPDADPMFQSMGLLQSGQKGLAPWSTPPGWQGTRAP